MTAVMGHGGDIGDEQPHPFGGAFGDHQNDSVPPKQRGMTINKKMHRLFKANGERPLKILFDINTNMPIGDVYGCFIREVGSYMWRDISFDKDTLTDESEVERRWFDFGGITNHPMALPYWMSLNNQICARYRGRENIAKSSLIDFAEGMWRQQGLEPLRDVDVNVFLQNPTFVIAIGDIIRSFKNKVNNNEVNNDGEDEDEDT
ncbi:unnamed protein product [Lactuca saligna]|uniref:Uncharacterized protein n=1 Tax=Lactuca saligna TaxID=75948 RepID=A0AA35UU34_LACSI|nr:unnamed protein product [Lactuca saligna]